MHAATSRSSSESQLLDAASVLTHLRRRGLIGADEGCSVETLGGGVSNIVLRVSSSRLGDVVVKQALPQLRVEREWLADPARTQTEAAALRIAATVDASWVPDVLDIDAEHNVLVIRAAPAGVTDWKRLLLHGEVDLGIAGSLGTFLAKLHTGTTGIEGLDSDELFEQLRLRPYFDSVAHRHARLAPALDEVCAALRRTRVCLVHGDASPKNVLVGLGMRWLIDFEVAHLGDPAFDVAFLCNHLLLKAHHLPQLRATFIAAIDVFLEAYRAAGGPASLGVTTTRLLGALLIARVDGDSPAEYLTHDEQAKVRSLGIQLLLHPERDVRTTVGALT
jgi:tRNA A-37 threonylcarbamoyl transferase component Bud32